MKKNLSIAFSLAFFMHLFLFTMIRIKDIPVPLEENKRIPVTMYVTAKPLASPKINAYKKPEIIPSLSLQMDVPVPSLSLPIPKVSIKNSSYSYIKVISSLEKKNFLHSQVELETKSKEPFSLAFLANEQTGRLLWIESSPLVDITSLKEQLTFKPIKEGSLISGSLEVHP